MTELEKFDNAGKGLSVRTIVLSSDAEKNAVINYVTRGNIAQLTDRAFRKELVAWIRFNPVESTHKGDGLAGRTTEQ